MTEPMTPDDVFDYAIALVQDAEGGLTIDPRDRGNWTGGSCGAGELKGTKFGISAASYPGLDIQTLTWDDACTIYRRDYWDAIRADTLPPPLAVVALDVAVNHGVGRLLGWLREEPHDEVTLTRRRMTHYTDLSTWPIYGKGWSRRAYKVLEAAHMLRARGDAVETSI